LARPTGFEPVILDLEMKEFILFFDTGIKRNIEV